MSDPTEQEVEDLARLIDPVAWTVKRADEEIRQRKLMSHDGAKAILAAGYRKSLPDSAVPEGYALVPIEPTPAMHDAAHQASLARTEPMTQGFCETNAAIWRAMIATAATPPAAGKGDGQ